MPPPNTNNNSLQEELERINREEAHVLSNPSIDREGIESIHQHFRIQRIRAEERHMERDQLEPISTVTRFSNDNFISTWQTLSNNRNSIPQPTFLYGNFVDSTGHDTHFTERQAGRSRQEEREVARRRERAEADAISRLQSLNSGRKFSDQYDRMCNDCQGGITTGKQDGWKQVGSRYVCGDCIRGNYHECSECHGLFLAHQILCGEEDNQYFCDPCQNILELSCCDDCGRLYDSGDENEEFCIHCREGHMESEEFSDAERARIRARSEPSWRHYSTKRVKSLQSDEPGNIIQSWRMFSVELETIYPSLKVLNRFLSNTPKAFGSCRDASIGGNGAEFQSPKMSGAAGEKAVTDFCKGLYVEKFTTDKTCGLHIHLDGAKQFTMGPAALPRLKVLFLFYLMFEDVIFSFLPKSRRRNKYCKSVKDEYHLSEILNAISLEELEQIWYRVGTKDRVENSKRDHRNSSRYAGVNFHTLLAENHLEIRYHSGTINATKILEWINLHTTIMDKIAREEITLNMLQGFQDFLFLEEKTEAFFATLNLSKESRQYFEKRQRKFTEKVEVPLEEEAFVLA